MSDDNESVNTPEDTAKSGNVMDNLTDADSTSHSVTTFSVAGDATIYTAGQTATTAAGPLPSPLTALTPSHRLQTSMRYAYCDVCYGGQQRCE